MSISGYIRREAHAVKRQLLSHKEVIFDGESRRSNWSPNLATIIYLHGFGVGDPSVKDLELQASTKFNTDRLAYNFGKDLTTVRRYLYKRMENNKKIGNNEVYLVGHSLGGLIAFDFGKHYPDLIDKAVAIAAPFHGTYVAHLAPMVTSARQMKVQSDYLWDFHNHGYPDDVEFVSIYSLDDEVVVPATSSRIDHPAVRNIEVPGMGHGALIHDFGIDVVMAVLEGLEVPVFNEKPSLVGRLYNGVCNLLDRKVRKFPLIL